MIVFSALALSVLQSKTTTTITCYTWHCEVKTWDFGIRRIFESFPHAIENVDVASGIPSFLLAISVQSPAPCMYDKCTAARVSSDIKSENYECSGRSFSARRGRIVLRMIHSMNTCKAHHCNHCFQGTPLSRVGTLMSTRMALILASILKATRRRDGDRLRLIGNRLVFVDLLVSREMLKLTR